MKPDRLERMYCVIGDAPEAIAGLRKLVVALAISDKLGNSADEGPDPQGLMERIDERKQELVRIGQLQEDQATSPVTQEELPDGLPLSARIVRLRAVAKIEKGPTGIAKAKPGPYPLVVTAEQRAACDHFDFDGAAAIIPLVSSTGHGKASLHRLHYQEGRFALGSILAAIFPYAPEVLSARFIFEYLSAFKEELLVSRMIGTANVSLSIGKVGDVPVPLIAPSAQARVDELMALCDRLEAARNERESRRDRLVAASLYRLSQLLDQDGDEAFRANARFYLNHLPRLTTRPDHVKQLRQTILNLAVRGLLVPQDPNDEPASELLNRIGAENARVIQSGLCKRQKPLVENKEYLALPCPQRWERIALGTVCNYVTSGSRGWSEYYAAEGAAFIRAQNIRFGTLDLERLARVKLPRETEGVRTQIRPGDLLIVITGAGVTNPALLDVDVGEGYVSQHVGLLKVTDPSLSRWLLICLMAPAGARAELQRCAYGAGRPGLNLDNLRSLGIPLPPLAEQRRIVAKVDALMALCDRLEANLAEIKADSRRLLEAVLHEALEPAEPALEAAE